MDTDPNRPSSKVARLIEEYELEGLGDELERRWTDVGDERQSLRELANLLNERILEKAMQDADINVLARDGPCLDARNRAVQRLTN